MGFRMSPLSPMLLMLCVVPVMATRLRATRSRAVDELEVVNFTTESFGWGGRDVNTASESQVTYLTLNESGGSGFGHNDMFLFGNVSMEIKLIPGNSAGTVVAFYLASSQLNRDEVDIMFLGNVSGQPYTVQTNIYANGLDNRKEKMQLWFDPSKEFHRYTVFWNMYHIVFYVDDIPIRVHKNHAVKGIPFPRRQPLGVYATIWNGEQWATQDGKVKIDWTQAPFIASFRNLRIDACSWKGNRRFCKARSVTNWWNKRRYSSLEDSQKGQLQWARDNFLIYDYCTDSTINNSTSPMLECFLPKY
uniref:Xyloglucan endotransglucosylase/hydrolase n=1 Tax=Wollemia nobilis TaxID=56998 RepID=A0A0C9S3Z0_9CONI